MDFGRFRPFWASFVCDHFSQLTTSKISVRSVVSIDSFVPLTALIVLDRSGRPTARVAASLAGSDSKSRTL